MMRRHNLCLQILGPLLVLLAACQNENTERNQADQSEQTALQTDANPTSPSPESTSPPASPTPFNKQTLLGYYVGEFVAEQSDAKKNPMRMNKINLSLDAIKENAVIGHSVVAGNNRPFTGTLSQKASGTFEVKAREPGDDPYDGAFNFTISDNQVNGKWLANDKKLAVTSRTYSLDKKSFKYNPDLTLKAADLNQSTDLFRTLRSVFDTEYETERDKQVDGISYHAERITEGAFKFNASKTVLKPQDIENLYKRDLEIMRNTIYARHGYSFQNRQMRYFFDHIDWYIPVSTDVTQQLTDIEQKNIRLLKRYEDYARAYYDHFGR